MRLTKEEKEICAKYSARDEQGFVHCNECPLVMDKSINLCKKVASLQEVTEYKEWRIK